MAEDAPSAPSFLRRRVAGIPVLYLAAGGVAVLAVVAWRMRATNDAETDVPMETNQNADADDPGSTTLNTGDTSYDGFVAKGSITAAPAEPPEQNVPEETNQTWLKKSVEFRVKQGASGGTVQSALQKYLSGSQLSYAEGQERDKAIKEFGLPPDPPEQTNPVNAPVVITPAKPQGTLPRYHRVVNANDDTFADIARIYYPTADSTSVNLIARYNYGRLVGSGPFKVGTTVYVPKYNVPKYYRATKSIDTASEIGRKNGNVPARGIEALNPGMKFPVKSGKRVRVA